MSRRVVILQRGTETISVVAALLAERGYSVAVARSYDEAVELVRDRCGALLVDTPAVKDCGQTLCNWVRDEIRPVPAMVGVLEDGDPMTVPCRRCMVTLARDAGVREIAEAVEEAVRWWPGDD